MMCNLALKVIGVNTSTPTGLLPNHTHGLNPHKTDVMTHLDAFKQFHIHFAAECLFKQHLAVTGGALAPGVRFQLVNFGEHWAGAEREL